MDKIEKLAYSLGVKKIIDEKEPCKYCDGVMKQLPDTPLSKNYCLEQRDKWRIVDYNFETNKYEMEIPITHCPMCGRRLEGKE